mgnify:CR=1 FL=1
MRDGAIRLLLRETFAAGAAAVKAIGAQNVGEGGRSGMMGRQAWFQREAAYENHREPAGLPASYDVILAYGKK